MPDPVLPPAAPFSRRQFLTRSTRTTLGLALAGTAPALLAACTRTQDPTVADLEAASPTPAAPGPAVDELTEAEAVVGDVIDFALASDDWPGDFGFVTLRLHRAAVDGEDAYYVRTDASDADYAQRERLVYVPRIGNLAVQGHAAAAYFVDDGTDDQPVVLSTEPGRDDYTPAFEVHRVRWQGEPRTLRSAADVEAAEQAGEVSVEATGIVVNAPLVAWSTGRLASDPDPREYLGAGQLLGEPDLEGLAVTFKLHECFPQSRYIVTDASAMADMMHIAAGPRLTPSTGAGATGRVNVIMGGPEGPGPMGAQPSVFDSRAGDPVWSPYWDHFVYAWNEDATPRVLRTEADVHAARDAGEMEEFVGTPDTGGEGFVVNCPVPVIAPETYGT